MRLRCLFGHGWNLVEWGKYSIVHRCWRCLLVVRTRP